MFKLLLAAAAGSLATASFMKMKEGRGLHSRGSRAGTELPTHERLPEPATEETGPSPDGMVMTRPDRNGNNVYYGS